MADTIGISAKVTHLFFDKPGVVAMVERKERKALSRVGAFIRRRARSSIRRRKKVSQPGDPPSAHSRSATATLKNIQFYYDKDAKSVIVGPVQPCVSALRWQESRDPVPPKNPAA